jgi:hypothetical protein
MKKNIYNFLPSSSLSGVCSLILFPLLATGVNDTGGKFVTGVNNTSEIGGKFATGVVDTGGQPRAANISANFRKNSKRP